MESGEDFTSYEDPDGACVTKQISVKYDHSKGRAGTLFWSSTSAHSDRPLEQSLPLNDVSDIYVGKQRRVFQMAFAAEAAEHCCLSIVGKHAVLDIEARSMDQ